MKLLRLGIVAIVAALGAAACGGGSSSSDYVAKVGSKPITKAQLRAVMNTYNGPAFPARESAEYRLLQEQAIDYLVQQSLAHQADAELGIKPEDRVVTHATWRKVVSGIHVSDAEVRAIFTRNPKRYKPGPNNVLDRGTATEIRDEVLRKERAAAMHRFVTATEKRWPVTYRTGYQPVSEMALARKVWLASPRKNCDLPAGSYPYAEARAHGCLANALRPGVGSPACPMMGSEGDGGFTSAEENDGYAGYLGDNAGTCIPDPRLEAVQVDAQQSTSQPPVKVSYLHAAGSATFKDSQTGLTLRYPRRLHFEQLSNSSVTGIEIANHAITAVRALSRRAIDFSFTQGLRGFDNPRSAPTVNLPIRITDADLASGQFTTQVSADGMSFNLMIRTGGSPSRQDVEALKAIVASIHFPPLRVGQFSPNRLYVLGPASKYPLGSVTEIAGGLRLPYYRKLRSGRSYLEHTKDGFWTITWPDSYLHGYKACGPHFDAKRQRFTCPNGAVWDLMGRVIKNPDPSQHPDDPLERTEAAVANGDVLISLQPPPG